MKKLSLFIVLLIALVASFMISSNVFAFENGEYIGMDYHEKEMQTHEDAIKTGKDSYTDYYINYHYTRYNDESYYIYCIDPDRLSGGENANLVVQRVLDSTDPVDAAILFMMNYDNYNYSERVMAIRAFVPFTQDFSPELPDSDETPWASYANSNTGLKWASEDPKKSIATMLGLSGNSLSILKKVATLYQTYDSNIVLNENNEYVRNAKELFLKALEYGAGIADGTISAGKQVEFTEPSFVSGTEAGVRDLVFTATFKGFNTEDANVPVNLVVTPDVNGNISGISYKYQVAGTDAWTDFNDSTDFKPLLNNESVTINFKITVKATAGTPKFKVNFKVEPKYEDSDNLVGALLYNTESPEAQRFYIHDSESTNHEPFTATLSWEDWTGYCTSNLPDKNNTNEYKQYVRDCCRNTTGNDFNIAQECNKLVSAAKTKEEREKILRENEYCKIKAEYCDPCNTTITVPQACTDFSPGEFEKGMTASITGPEDVKTCVLNSEDENNKSYKLARSVSLTNGSGSHTFTNNKYCSVSCKEDYNFDLPTGRYVISGRYFTLKMGVQATRTCYTDMIDLQKFHQDIAYYESKIEEYLNAKDADKNNSEFVSIYNSYKQSLVDIQACSLGWDDDYVVNPEISFDYEEEYIDKLLGGNELKFKMADDKKTSQSKWFCDGEDVDKTYNECIGSNATSKANTKSESFYRCSSSNGGTYSCSTYTLDIPTTRFAKISKTFNASYAPESVFFTKYSTGVVEVGKDGINTYTKLDEYLDSKIDDSIKIKTGGLPVSLKDGKGVYNYDIKFAKVGEFFDSRELGRLVGAKESAALVNDDTMFKGTYVCSYVVNCPECNVTCVPDYERGIFCQIDTPTDEPVECIGSCAFDSGFGEMYSIHQTSLTNFNPTGRELGANLTTEKGDALIASMTEKGESIYNTPEYSFTFTPAVIAFLRNDVNAQSKEDGYLGEPKNYEMNCKLYSEITGDASIKETKKDYLICQSSVLDALANDYNAIKFNALADSREKVQSWLDSEYCQTNTCAIVGAIGPAWK